MPFGGLTCCLGAAALYIIGWISRRDADFLKSVPRATQLKQLARLLDTAGKVLPLVVVSGRVGSGTPINCEYSGLHGVIVVQRAKQHFLKRNDEGSWIQDSAFMPVKFKEVPWFLDDGTARVGVVGVRNAAGLELEFGREVFEKSGQSGTSDNLQGLKMVGVERTEHVLPTGTPLTVVGEAVKDDTGSVCIRRPKSGPFYASDKTIDEPIADLGKSSRLYKFASMCFAAFGVYLLAECAIQYIMEKRPHWEMHRRALPAAEAEQDEGGLNGEMQGRVLPAVEAEQDEGILNNEAENGSDGSRLSSLNSEAENGSDSARVSSLNSEAEDGSYGDGTTSNLCVICLDRECKSVFVPCGHMCCCMQCASRVDKCPLCRRRISQVVRTYRS